MLQKFAFAMFLQLFLILHKCLSCETDFENTKCLAASEIELGYDEQVLALNEAKFKQFDLDLNELELKYNPEQVSALLDNLEQELVKCENMTESRTELKIENLSQQLKDLTLNFEKQIKEKDDKILKLQAQVQNLTASIETSQKKASTGNAFISQKTTSFQLFISNRTEPFKPQNAKTDLTVDHFERPFCVEDQPENLECLVSEKVAIGCSTLHGVQPIYFPFGRSIRMFCNADWMIIQRRLSGKVDFNRGWNEYIWGFGSFRDNFFLGLEKIHLITTALQHELLIQFVDSFKQRYYAHYDHFKIGNEQSGYALQSLGQFRGTSKNFMQGNLYMKFNTWDRSYPNMVNCAEELQGAWWHSLNDCRQCNLNGRYDHGIFWGRTTYQGVHMLIRPKLSN